MISLNKTYIYISLICIKRAVNFIIDLKRYILNNFIIHQSEYQTVKNN